MGQKALESPVRRNKRQKGKGASSSGVWAWDFVVSAWLYVLAFAPPPEGLVRDTARSFLTRPPRQPVFDLLLRCSLGSDKLNLDCVKGELVLSQARTAVIFSFISHPSQ